MKPFRHSRDSANIAYYGEDAPQSPDRIWAEVMRSDFRYVPDGDGHRRAIPKPRPDFYFTVYRGTAANEVARFTYTPRSRPRPGALPARTVARLVRARL